MAFDAAANDAYGHSVGIEGDVAFVGSYQDDCVSGGNCGAGYVYQFDGTAWRFEQKLGASDSQAGDQLGSTVALSDMFAVANAGLVDCAAGADCGAAYVFSVDCKLLVPAVSQWSMVALVLGLLAGLTMTARLGLKKGRRHVFG